MTEPTLADQMMDTLASSLWSFGFVDAPASVPASSPVATERRRPYRDDVIFSQENDKDFSGCSRNSESDDDDDDFGDFIDAPPSSKTNDKMHTTNSTNSTETIVEENDDYDFGDFAAAPLSTAVAIKDRPLFPENPPTIHLFHTATAVYEVPPSVSLVQGGGSSKDNAANDLFQKQTSLLVAMEESEESKNYGTTTILPMASEYTEKSINSLKGTHHETGNSRTSQSQYDTFPLTASEEYQASYIGNHIRNEPNEMSQAPFHPSDADEQFDFARPPPVGKAVPEVDFSAATTESTSSPTVGDVVEIPKLPPPKSQSTTTTATNLVDLQLPPSEANLLELPPPQSQSTFSSTAEEINFFEGLVHCPPAPSTSLDCKFQNFTMPLSSVLVGEEAGQSLESVVPSTRLLDTLPRVDHRQKSDQDQLEDEEWGDFTGCGQDVETKEVPKGRAAKTFEITTESPNRFRFYNPVEGDKLDKLSPLIDDNPPSQTILSEPQNPIQRSSIKPTPSVRSVTTVETDAFARLSAENHLPEIEALRRQLMEQTKEASQRIHLLQVQHAKAIADLRIEANRKAQEHQKVEIERLCRSVEAAETSSKKACEQLVHCEAQIDAINEKHAKELHERDLLLKSIQSEVEDSIRREMHSKLQENETMHMNTVDHPDPRQESCGVVKVASEKKEDVGTSSLSYERKKESRREKLSLQAEILSLKQKLEKAQKLVDSQTTQAQESLIEKQNQITQLQDELKSVRESLFSKEDELENSISSSINEAIEWEAKYKTLLEESTSDKFHLKSQMEEIRKSEQTLRISEARLSRQVEQLEKQLEASAESLASAFGSESAMEDVLQKEREDHCKRYSRMELKLSAERDAFERNANQCASLLSEKERAFEILRSSVKEEKEKIRTLYRNEIRLQQVAQRLQKAIDKSEEEVKLRDRIIEGLRQDLLGRDGDFATLEKELEEVRENNKSPQGQRKVNLDYLKDVVVKYLSHPPGSSERAQLLPVLATLLHFDSTDYKIIEAGKQKLSWWGSVNPTII